MPTFHPDIIDTIYSVNSTTQSNPMTVSDLMENLRAYPPDWPVVIPGYEGGFAEIHGLIQTELLRDVNSEWYYGAHDRPDSVSNPQDYKKFTALLITK